MTFDPAHRNMAGESDHYEEIQESIDRPQISPGYFNEEGDRVSKIPPSLSKKGLLKSLVRETKYTGESEASRKRYSAELSTLLPNYLWKAFGIQSMVILNVPTIGQNNLQFNMVGPHMETLLQATETGQRIVRDINVLCSRIPRPDPLPKNLSDLLIKQDNLHEKKKAIALGEKPAVAKVTSAARKQAELRLKKRENMTAEEIKKWDELGAAVKTFKQAKGKGSKSVGNSSININPAKQPTPPRSMKGGHEMSSNSAATSKENCPESVRPNPSVPISTSMPFF